MKNSSRIPQISIGIPTYEAGQSLVSTLQSLYRQTAIDQVKEILVAVDGKSLPQDILWQIDHPKLVVQSFHPRKGQAERINDLCKMAKGDLLILTNDDVILDSRVVEEFSQAYQTTHADLFTGHSQPLPNTGWIEQSLEIGYDITHEIIQELGSSTYLACNGRLIALSRQLYTQLRIPAEIWNNDAYVYFFAKGHGLVHSHVPTAKVYFRSPATLVEHVKQSQKFQASQAENKQFFSFSSAFAREYAMRPKKFATAFCKIFLRKPLLSLGYLAILFYSRFLPKSSAHHAQGYWQTDMTTKAVESAK